MSINDFMLFHSRKLESLRTCMDFNDFARERIYERIPPKASSLEKTACVARMSAESLKWLIDDTHTRYNRLNRKARGQRLSPFVFQRASCYPNYWLFEVVKACILAGSFPLESKGYDSLAPDRQSNPEFNKRWPKTPGATAFWGASMSTAEAISGALLMFLKKSFLWAFPELPNYTALRPGLCEPYDKENLERNFSETGDVLPLIPTWQNLSLGSVVEYISPAEWPPAKLDREYSRVSNLLTHEVAHIKFVTSAEAEQSASQKPARAGQGTEENIFRKDGDKWIVVFNHSEPCYLKDSKGMEQIAQLLAKTPKSISAIELANPKNDTKLMILSNSDKPQEIIDKDTLQSCQKRIIDIKNELADAEKNNDLAAQERLKAEQEQILSELNAARNLKGESRSFTDNLDKARKAVTNAIKRALENIKTHNMPLYRHLDNSIQRGIDFAYKPDRQTNWQL